MITSSVKKNFKILSCYWKIFGLFPFQLTDSNLLKISPPGIVYATILCFAYLISFQNIMANAFKTTLVYSTPMAIISDELGVCFNTLTVLSMWILPIIRVQKINNIIRKFRETSVSLNQVGIYENLTTSIKKLINICLVVNIGFCLHFILNNFLLILWADNYWGWLWFDIGLVIIPNTLVIFFSALIVLKARFKKINHLVINLPRVNESRYDSASHLKSISQIHADLKKLVGSINNLFSLPVLLLLAANFIEFAACVYLSYNKLQEEDYHRKWEVENIITVLALMAWVFFYSLLTFFVINVPSSTVREANKTGNALHGMTLNHHQQPAISKIIIEMVSLRLLQQPAKMSLHGFIELDSSLLFNIIKTITSLLVIMLQLDQQARDSSTEILMALQSPSDHNNYSTYSSNPNGPFLK